MCDREEGERERDFFVVVFPPGGGESIEAETEQEGASEDGGDVGRVALHEGIVDRASELCGEWVLEQS